MSFEIDGQTGVVITETQQGCTQPADYSFACVNDFVHRVGRHYEELEALCLGMASHFEKLNATIEPQQPQTKTQPDFYAIARNSRMLSQSRVFSSIDNANHFKDHLNKEWGCDDYSVIPLYTAPLCKELSGDEILKTISVAIGIETWRVSASEILAAKAVLKAAGYE